MSQIVLLSLSFFAVVSCLMALRISGDWLSITVYGDSRDTDNLSRMRATLAGWVARHLFCAVGATILCIMVRAVPSLDAFPGADALLAGYGILSFLFASLDHALFQKVTFALTQVETGRC